MFYFAYAGAEHVPGDWLSTYVVLQIGASEAEGAFVTSVYGDFLDFDIILDRLSRIPFFGFTPPYTPW